MAVNDMYQVVLNGVRGVDEFSNVFWYQQVIGINDPANAESLAELFDTHILLALQKLVTTTVDFQNVTVVNYPDPTDFFVRSLLNYSAGLLDPPDTPSYCAFAYRFERPTPGKRAGYKRFVGAPDDNVNGNTWAPDTGDRDDLATALRTNLTDGVNVWQPCVVVHKKKADPTYKIQLYVNPERSYYVGTVTPLTVITTQNSRKRANVN